MKTHTFDVRAPKQPTPARPFGPNVAQKGSKVRCLACKKNIPVEDMDKECGG